MEYQLIRQHRKSIGIYIRDNGVEVRVPQQLSKAEIDQFVKSKRDWIARALTEQHNKLQQKAAFTLNYGDTVRYRGQEYPITAVPGNHVGYNGSSFWLPPDLPPAQIKAACIQIYRLFAKPVLTEKVLAFAAQMKVQPSSLKINGAKTRWGSCSTEKSLNFSWRLLMAADEAIDYVVVHELAHIREMNHSARFWSIVAAVLPDYKQRQMSLKELQKKLLTENWE